jgi:hypothetical protein
MEQLEPNPTSNPLIDEQDLWIGSAQLDNQA